MKISKTIISLTVLLAITTSVSLNAQAKIKYLGVDKNKDSMLSLDEWNGSNGSFKRLDKNHDGVLSGNEVRGPIKIYSSNSFAALDLNSDGFINLREWDGTNLMFRRVDRDRNGVLNVLEFANLSTVALANSNPNPTPVFRELDQNYDGSISRNEWNGSTRAFTQLDTNRDEQLSRYEYFDRNDTSPRDLNGAFRRLDQNSDRRISRAEWTASYTTFNNLDANDNNYLSEREFYSKNKLSVVESVLEQIFSRQ